MNNIVNNNVPDLRFGEFEEDWLSESINSVFTIFNGYAFKSKDSTIEGIRWIKIADVGIGEIKSNNMSYLPIDFIDKYEKYSLSNDDYVVALTRPILNNKLKIAKITGFDQPALLNQRVGKVKSSNNLEFIYQMLQRNKLIFQIDSRIAGTDPPNLSPSEIHTLKVGIPKGKKEQQKIANFLTSVDQRISLLKQKKAALEQYKKGLMQKIFSQEIRFKDENGKDFADWEEMRFEELYQFKRTNSFSREKLNYKEGEFLNIHYGDIHTKFKTHFNVNQEDVPYVNNEVDVSKIKDDEIVKSGDLIIADASEDYDDIGKSIEATNIQSKKVIAGLHTFLARRINNKLEIGFGGFLMKSEKVRLQIKKIAQGTKVLGISMGRMNKIILKIPCKEEQQKIADCLSSMDQSINKLKKQIEQTNLFKKGLLQRMFV